MHEWHLADRVLTWGARPRILGIVNVTPDSFSDGGQFSTTDAAVEHALNLVRQGADILDVGGESSRPGSQPVAEDEELRRVVPVIEALTRRTETPISVDTTKCVVARESLRAGARIVNDITALRGEAGMLDVIRDLRAGVILMHMQGTPATMQLAPTYQDVVAEVHAFFEERLAALSAAGIDRQSIVLDPGIGFGKTSTNNLDLIAGLPRLQDLGRPLCLGVSRKGFLGKVLNDRPVERRVAASLAAVCHAACRGAVQLVRVHDVEETSDALAILAAIDERTS